MSRPKIKDFSEKLQFLSTEESAPEFAPWQRGERGQQVYIKLKKEQEAAFLYVGEHNLVETEIQQTLLRLVNEGWNVQGEVTLTFEGTSEPGVDPYVYQDPITLELGQDLLALVDPQQGALLPQALPALRDEIAHETGLVPAGVRVKDNLRIGREKYLIRLKDTPIATGELFLDRFLAIGAFDQLSQLEGWATIEPAYRLNAKWIELPLRDKANQLGCDVLGPLQVLLTHLKSVMMHSAPELLGLQDTYNLISRLQVTHPVVVEEFLNDRRNLRVLRRVLQDLLSERVSLSNLVTILEVAGEGLDRGLGAQDIVEKVRRELSRQICWEMLNAEGELRCLVFDASVEDALKETVRLLDETGEASITPELADNIVSAVRKGLRENRNPPVIFTAPPYRQLLSRLLAGPFPALSVMSTAEICPGIKVVVNAPVSLAKEAGEATAAAPSAPEASEAEASPEVPDETEVKAEQKKKPSKGENLLSFITGKHNKDKKDDQDEK